MVSCLARGVSWCEGSVGVPTRLLAEWVLLVGAHESFEEPIRSRTKERRRKRVVNAHARVHLHVRGRRSLNSKLGASVCSLSVSRLSSEPSLCALSLALRSARAARTARHSDTTDTDKDFIKFYIIPRQKVFLRVSQSAHTRADVQFIHGSRSSGSAARNYTHKGMFAPHRSSVQ